MQGAAPTFSRDGARTDYYGPTCTVPCIMARWTWQWYGKSPAVGKFHVTVYPAPWVPEFQIPLF